MEPPVTVELSHFVSKTRVKESCDAKHCLTEARWRAHAACQLRYTEGAEPQAAQRSSMIGRSSSFGVCGVRPPLFARTKARHSPLSSFRKPLGGRRNPIIKVFHWSSFDAAWPRPSFATLRTPSKPPLYSPRLRRQREARVRRETNPLGRSLLRDPRQRIRRAGTQSGLCNLRR